MALAGQRMTILWILVTLLTIEEIQARGPHHPRGEKIVKQHVHYRPTREVQNEKLTQDEQLLHDIEHIQEDLGEFAENKDISGMTDEELEFHYFQLHDFDHNNKLDGLEILQAIHHTEKHENGERNETETTNEQDEFAYYVELIDRVLSEDDLDNDGFLSYPEYVEGRRKDNQNVEKTLIKSEDEVNVQSAK